MSRVSLQRLFSTFANGWPGAGILLQRGLAGSILLYYGILQVVERPRGMSIIPEIIGAAAGLFLLIGLWTPVTGTVAAVVQLWAIFTGIHEPFIAVVSGTLGASIAMIGPGAWSIDARIFGRKHIETRLPPKSRSAPLH
jgi:putative oxidoreductase